MPWPNFTDMPLRRITFLAAGLLAASVLGACGSKTTVVTDTGAGSTSTRASTGAARSSTSTSGTTTTGAPTSTAAGTTTTGGVPACTAAMLKLGFLGGQGATGHGELGFSLTNTSGHSCHTYGYPGILFLNASGQPLPTVPTRTTHDFFGQTPAVVLTVSPGRAVSFRLGVTHGASSPAGCTTAHGLQAIPPDDTQTLRTDLGNGGAYECRTATVSPLRPGTSAYP